MRRRFAFLIDSGFFEIAMRGSGVLAVFWLFSAQCLAADDKWVWGNGRNSNAARLLPGGKYAVIDEYQYPNEGSYRPRPTSSLRPSGLPPLIRPVANNVGDNRFPPPPPIDQRPYPQGTGLGLGSFGELPSYRPPLSPPPPNQFGGAGRPPFPSAGVDESYDPTKFQKCKCTHSFNCRSPGILFGSCDSGKQYCCEKELPPSRATGFPTNDGAYPEVLAGPGGPVDHLRPSVGVYGRAKSGKP